MSAQRKAALEPDSFDIYDHCFHNLDIVWFWRAIQPIELDRIERWAEVSELTKHGRISPLASSGRGENPARSLYVQPDLSLGAKPSARISMLPTVHNLDAFAYLAGPVPGPAARGGELGLAVRPGGAGPPRPRRRARHRRLRRRAGFRSAGRHPLRRYRQHDGRRDRRPDGAALGAQKEGVSPACGAPRAIGRGHDVGPRRHRQHVVARHRGRAAGRRHRSPRPCRGGLPRLAQRPVPVGPPRRRRCSTRPTATSTGGSTAARAPCWRARASTCRSPGACSPRWPRPSGTIGTTEGPPRRDLPGLDGRPLIVRAGAVRAGGSYWQRAEPHLGVEHHDGRIQLPRSTLAAVRGLVPVQVIAQRFRCSRLLKRHEEGPPGEEVFEVLREIR